MIVLVRMINENFPNAEVAFSIEYGNTPASGASARRTLKDLLEENLNLGR